MDKKVFEKMFTVSQQYPIVGRFAGWFASGSAKLFWIAYLAGIVILIIMRDPKIVIFLLFPSMTFLTSHTFRQVIKRQRPYEEYPIKPYISNPKRKFGMPSNHSASAMIIAMAAIYLNFVIGIILVGLAVLTGICRIFSGVHYPFDVCVGWTLAIIYGSVMLYILL